MVKFEYQARTLSGLLPQRGLEPVNDIDVHARLTRKYEKHIEKEQMDYRNIILAGDVVDADI